MVGSGRSFLTTSREGFDCCVTSACGMRMLYRRTSTSTIKRRCGKTVVYGKELSPLGGQRTDWSYSNFLEANPTFQDRVEAFTSGLVAPDPKATVLWAMEPGMSYTVGELHRRVKEFVGRPLPISYAAMWSYCRGNGRWPGVLEKFGLVVNETGGQVPGPFAFAKTAAGADFGDPIAARALWLSRRLTSKYRSMLRVFGGTNKSEGAKTRRGYAVYKVVKLLAANPQQMYRKTDISELTNISTRVISLVLNALGPAGVINYESPQRERGGQVTTGWAQYSLVNRELLSKDVGELYAELRRDRPSTYLKGYLQCVLDYIRSHPKAIYSAETFPRATVDTSYFSNILAFLKSKGFLASYFEGGAIQSRTTANKNTGLLWDHLLAPIEAVAQRLDLADSEGFSDVLDFYESNPETRMAHVQHMLAQYHAERVQRGLEGSQDIDAALLMLPKKVMKLSAIAERLNKVRRYSLSARTVCYHLDGLVRSGKFERPERGYYRRL